MPGTTENRLVGPVEGTESKGEVNPLPPRQPTSLQGLLRFAMEATKSEDAPNASNFEPMDEERKKFLEDALKSMTIDVIEVLQKQIHKLKLVGQLKPGDNVEEYIEAIETISDYVDHIDTANDFHKIGGFMILEPCIKCSVAEIRAGGCELIALLAQNNPYCQRIFTDNKFLLYLKDILMQDKDVSVITKAIYAISCIIRENYEGYTQFIAMNGIQCLLTCMQTTKNEKIIVKAAFLLSNLCKSYPQLKLELMQKDCFKLLIPILDEERNQGHEFALALLVTILEDNDSGVKEVLKPVYKFKDMLLKYRSSILNRDECLEEEQYVRRLLHLIG